MGAGVLASMIVVAQYYLLKTESSELDEMLNWNRSLRPFPFHTSQYSLYTNMVPMRLMMCNQALERDMENRFVPKAHLESSGICGMTHTDEALVRRCRARRQSSMTGPSQDAAARRLAELQKVECPSSPHMEVDQEMSDQHKCVLVSIGQLLGFRPGQLVLDWGSGCGHKLSWAKMLFDVDGIGVDIQAAAVSWAQVHSAGRFCHADGRDLRWVPDGMFDFAISYAAIYHLTQSDQCYVGWQLAAKLRVGGKAFLGWNKRDVMTNWEWMSCFRGAKHTVTPGVAALSAEELAKAPWASAALAAVEAGVEVDVETVEDGFLFPPDVHKVSGNGSFLFQYPAYTIFFTRIN